MLTSFLVACACLMGQNPDPASKSENTGWTPLFNGQNLDGWYTFLQKHGKNRDPDHVITIEDGTIHLYKHAADAAHVVMGYIGTEKEYGDYHLRLQYRWGDKKFEPRYKLKRDAGVYYHITGSDNVWPRALQFQIEQTNVGDLIALYGMQLDSTVDPKTQGEAMPTFLPASLGGVRACSEARASRTRSISAANSNATAGIPPKSSLKGTRSLIFSTVPSSTPVKRCGSLIPPSRTRPRNP